MAKRFNARSANFRARSWAAASHRRVKLKHVARQINRRRLAIFLQSHYGATTESVA